MSGPMIPGKNPQYVPVTSTSSRDCVASTAGVLDTRATVDAIRRTHDAYRKASGAPATRGLYLWEAAKAAKALDGIILEPSMHLSRNTVRDTVAGGSASGCTILCSVTRYTERRTNYAVGLHEIVLLAYNQWPGGERCACEKATTTSHAEFTVYDPGISSVGPRQWSADLVYRAAEAVTGGQGINLLVAPDTEGVSWKAVDDAAIRSLPSYSKGRTIRRLKVGEVLKGGRTENGGNWKRANGTYGNGWRHNQLADGSWAWTKGPAMEAAA